MCQPGVPQDPKNGETELLNLDSPVYPGLVAFSFLCWLIILQCLAVFAKGGRAPPLNVGTSSSFARTGAGKM